MKNILPIFVLVTLMVSSISCSKEYGYEVDEEIQPYFDMFEAAALARGRTVDLELEGIGATIDFIRDNSTVGQCQTIQENGLRRIHIDRAFWNDFDEYGKQFIVFHELGHCYLDRDHDNSVRSGNICESIMQSGISGCTSAYGPDTREEYLDELFGI